MLGGCDAGLGDGEDELSPGPPRDIAFGFNDNSVRDGQLSASRDAELAAGAGAEVLRVAVEWRGLEERRDVYDWELFDGIYRALRARGMRPLWIPVFAPSWAWDRGVRCSGNCPYPPRRSELGEWEELLELLARRYPESVGIELWNEPNLAAFWRPRPDAARYTELLRRGYRAIKKVRPELPVVLGGLSNRPRSGRGGDSLSEFLEAVYRHGGRGHMDAIAIHPYLRDRIRPATERTIEQVLAIRRRHDDEGTPLWVTEFGASTTGQVLRERWSEEEQATALVDGYDFLSQVPGVEMFLVHTLLDPPLDRSSREAGFGLVRPDGSLRPAYCAFARRLRGAGVRC